MQRSKLTRTQWTHIMYLRRQIRIEQVKAKRPCNERGAQIYIERAKAFAEALAHYEYSIAIKKELDKIKQ